MTAQLKRFRIEQTSDFNAPEFVAPSEPAMNSAGVSEILQELKELKAAVKPAGKIMVDIVEAYRHEISEVMKLRTDLQEIESSIHSTRKEMASLHVGAPSTVGMDQLSDELGAVVSQTAAAANTILTSAEAIGDELSALRKQAAKSGDITPNIDKMELEVSKLFESCHFQDLTGQRIARICDTLSFVERQISRLTNIWGGLEALDHLLEVEAIAKAEQESSIGDHSLANGPQLMAEEMGHVNQLEIDSLFD
jgi:chemotaxis protein CheZ